MCGLAGFFDPKASGERDMLARAEAMAEALAHRGPDDSGAWADAPAGFAVAHRRLSIIDLSPAGHQPMVSSDGRYVIAYNGEVYNFRELRAELEAAGRAFHGDSDTEVVLEAWAAWGAERAVKRLLGMFAFAVWDRQERTVTLVRDRLGIKPLYWSRIGGLFLFGSELKALNAHPGWTPNLDRSSLAAFLRYGYVPSPASIYRGVFKLEPGTFLVVQGAKEPVLRRYWSLDTVVQEARDKPLEVSDEEAATHLEELLGEAVAQRMVADVPLGAFLSGGIDSSTVVALMQARANQPVKTFTIGFREEAYNEAAHAAEVARHLATDHTELYVEPEHALEIVPSLPDMYDEPFADPSQIPTFLISKLTRQHVTVSLSGDGGDEIFGGYNRYLLASRLWRYMALVPRPLRQAFSTLIRAVPPDALDRLAPLFLFGQGHGQAGDKLHKLAGVLDAKGGDALYQRLISLWNEAESIVPGSERPRDFLMEQDTVGHALSLSERMRHRDTLTYLPDDILAKVDRASMAVSLEARVPILDHRVVEFAWRLPAHQIIRGGETKWLLRRVLYRHVPRALVERPKMGFGVPIASWLRGPLRDWAEDLLSESSLREKDLFDPVPVRKKWAEHLSGRRNWQYQLWCVLMAQAWSRRWLSGTRPKPGGA